MGKAFMLSGPDGGCASGDEHPLLGGGGTNTGDTNASFDVTEAATFSDILTRVISGNSGSMTFRMRVDGANGNLVMTRSGTGDASDSVNTDVVSAGSNVNFAYTDTGTNSSIAFLRTLVSFSSGHGNFHGTFGISGRVFDVGGATQYIGLAGDLFADGTATIANAQWKNRGYTTVEAIQVRVTANARVNDSTVRLNVNGTDVGTAITIGAAATGEFKVTGMAQAIATGDLVCLSITLGAGVEDLTIASACVTFKSTSNSSETFVGNYTGVARAASATESRYPIGAQLFDSSFTEAQQRIAVGFAARCRNLRCYLSANTYGADATATLYKNGSAAITLALTAGGGAGWYENSTDTVDINSTDELSIGVVGGTSGSATIHHIGFTLDPPANSVGKGLTRSVLLDRRRLAA